VQSKVLQLLVNWSDKFKAKPDLLVHLTAKLNQLSNDGAALPTTVTDAGLQKATLASVEVSISGETHTLGDKDKDKKKKKKRQEESAVRRLPRDALLPPLYMPTPSGDCGAIDAEVHEIVIASMSYKGRTWNPVMAALGGASQEQFCGKIQQHRKMAELHPGMGQESLEKLKQWNNRLSIALGSEAAPEADPLVAKETPSEAPPEASTEAPVETPVETPADEVAVAEAVVEVADEDPAQETPVEEPVQDTPAEEEPVQDTPEPAPAEESASDLASPKSSPKTKESSPKTKSTHHDRLTAFYAKYAPDKIDQVPTFLDKYKGKEEKMWTVLIKKYGPEPS